MQKDTAKTSDLFNSFTLGQPKDVASSSAPAPSAFFLSLEKLKTDLAASSKEKPKKQPLLTPGTKEILETATAASSKEKPMFQPIFTPGTKEILETATAASSKEKPTFQPIFTPVTQKAPELAKDCQDVPGSAATLTTSSKMMRDPPFVFSSQQKLESLWRHVKWTEEQKTSLMQTISSYRPSHEETTRARVLLLGPVGSGKSSFISSVQSVFMGRVTNRAMVGSSSTSFTKKLQSFNIHGQKGEDPTGLVLCDTLGLGYGEMTGLTLHDILSIIKGHVPEGHKFSLDQPVRSETVGYVKKPSFKEKIHCVVFVVDACKVLAYPKSLIATFQLLREHISDLGVHQVALLTHVDQLCPETAKDVTKVYGSRVIKEMMGKAAALLGMPTSYMVPVKNYSSELDVDVNTDVLLLSAVDHILQYTDLYFQDNMPQEKIIF